MVALQLPCVNRNGSRGRTLRAMTPCYTRLVDRRQELILAKKPEVLRRVGSLHKKVMKQYQTLQKHERTPLQEAEFYAREMESRGLKSIAALTGLLKLPANRVSLHLSLLRLPEPIRKFLAEHRTPEYARYFTERRLRDLVRMDARSAWRRFQAMVTEAKREAGIWKSNGQ